MAGRNQRAGRSMQRSRAKEQSWRGHLKRQSASGLSIRAYCAGHGLSEPSFYAWRAELARRDAQRRKRPTFLPVTVGAGISAVEFQVPGGFVIRVPAHDCEALVAVWDLVKGRT